ncbi:MAG: diacylglycerol kinase family protein [Anaeromyxobacteraceae bacterium]
MLRLIQNFERQARFHPAADAAPAAGTEGVAVLLNGNAKAVNARVRDSLLSVVPSEHVYFTTCPDEASRVAEAVVDRGYHTVFTGGGDGTFVAWVNRILEIAERRFARAPRFGVLALGTGNAVAEMVGADPRRHTEDLVRYLRGEAGTRRLPLLDVGGRRTPFAGVGLDAAILNDYNWVRQRLAETPLRGLGLGAPGYGLAVALRSAPRYLMERRPGYCEIVNTGRTAWRLDARGNRIGRPVEHGELLYAGPCALAAASTVPYYGLGLKAFPFADRAPGMFQLRLASSVPVADVLLQLPRLFSGEFSHEVLHDFSVERVALSFERPMPLQIGGDAEGWRDGVQFGLAPGAVEVVDFAPSAAA